MTNWDKCQWSAFAPQWNEDVVWKHLERRRVNDKLFLMSIGMVLGQNVTGQNVTDRMSRTKCYGDKMSLNKMSRTKSRGQNVVVKMSWSKCRGQNVVVKMSWSKCPGQNVLVKMSWSKCPGQNVLVKMSWWYFHWLNERICAAADVKWIYISVGAIYLNNYKYKHHCPTQDSNPGGRIQNHKRWPLHTTTAHLKGPADFIYAKSVNPKLWGILRTILTKVPNLDFLHKILPSAFHCFLLSLTAKARILCVYCDGIGYTICTLVHCQYIVKLQMWASCDSLHSTDWTLYCRVSL